MSYFGGLIFTCAKTGGHLNPAISTGFWCIGEFGWLKWLHYMTAQFLGSLIGGIIAFALLDAKRAPSIPLQSTESWWRFLFSEFFGTFLFVLAVLVLVRS